VCSRASKRTLKLKEEELPSISPVLEELSDLPMLDSHQGIWKEGDEDCSSGERAAGASSG